MAKKSYLGLIIWTITFIAISFAPAFLPFADGILITRVIMAAAALGIAVLTFMIYLNGRAYWYNGITYEQAVSAGLGRCRAYARRHFIRFGIFGVGYTAFSVIMYLLQVGIWVDIVIFCVGIIAIAVSSVGIKL